MPGMDLAGQNMEGDGGYGGFASDDGSYAAAGGKDTGPVDIMVTETVCV